MPHGGGPIKVIVLGPLGGFGIKQHLFCKSRFLEAGRLAFMFR